LGDKTRALFVLEKLIITVITIIIDNIHIYIYLVGGFIPSEKYESQLGCLVPIYGKKSSKPPTTYIYIPLSQIEHLIPSLQSSSVVPANLSAYLRRKHRGIYRGMFGILRDPQMLSP
jgi:hypothetical protein